jgi:hypothetical protein
LHRGIFPKNVGGRARHTSHIKISLYC